MTKEISDEEYSILVLSVIKHIEQVKTKDSDISLIDIIYDYCFKNNVEPEMVGDAISNDIYFKSFISKDCENNNMLKKNIKKSKDW